MTADEKPACRCWRRRGIVKIHGSGSLANKVLKGIDVSLLPGELTLLMGPSGSGKTTLLSIMGCLMTPTEGDLKVAGEKGVGLSAEALADIRRRHIGFVFQSYNLFPTMNVLDNVLLAMDVRRTRRADPVEMATKALIEVGLSHRIKAFPSKLSGGEKQRVAIARALAGSPSVVLADEPTAALDTENGKAVMALLSKVGQDPTRAVLAVTHDHRMLPYADRIIRIEDGHIQSATSGRRQPRKQAAQTMSSHQHQGTRRSIRLRLPRPDQAECLKPWMMIAGAAGVADRCCSATASARRCARRKPLPADVGVRRRASRPPQPSPTGASARQRTAPRRGQTPVGWIAAAPGRVEPRNGEIRIGTPILGRVIEVLVGVGATVEDGELLVRLDDDEARARMAAAEYEAGARRQERDRLPTTAGREDVRRAEDAVYAAERGVTGARFELDFAQAARRKGTGTRAERRRPPSVASTRPTTACSASASPMPRPRPSPACRRRAGRNRWSAPAAPKSRSPKPSSTRRASARLPPARCCSRTPSSARSSARRRSSRWS